ncbi:MAG: hypothetical protein KDI31_17995, partial [Pseudomonadales bacterium]|nr:hypothetical protein [Pseudomonadales bacterium]
MQTGQQRAIASDAGTSLGRTPGTGWFVPVCVVLCLIILLPTGAAWAAERRIELPNGDLYVGRIVDSARTGYGVYTWADGHRYEGEFLD